MVDLQSSIVVAAYVLTVILCTVLKSPFMSVSNREGFLAFTELTPIFLIAMKNLILSLFLGLRTCANWEADYTCSYPVRNSWLVYQGPFPAPCPLPLTNVRGTQPLSVFASPPSTTRISPSSCPQGNALGVRVNLVYSTPMCTKQTTRSSPRFTDLSLDEDEEGSTTK
ncbi:hypothetical protein NLJ89_g9683 [Agrocybe chaxingu]|uniref:Uncharacterized protein n=1 Tax=Agrocybe chaxingu TaxID=84603 RepID=A0A9W8MSV1_9AGAR|nr:hypothetical protein NLJ89_g9683 [Agrocybe chaxingu]